MTRSAPRVSVLTPVYNGQRYIAEAIESVLAQTFGDFEYVIYDNQSTDETPAILARFAAQDSRIRVLRSPEFFPVCRNHNYALRTIDPGSAYCKIIHADDWLYPECLAKMVSLAERHPSVGVVGSFRLEDREVMHDGLLPYSQETISGRDVIRTAILGPPWVTGSPSSLLFRCDLLRRTHDFFDESVWHFDTEGAYRALMDSDFGFVHQVLSFTRLHPGALTSFSHRVNTYISHDGRILARYGRQLFDEREFRSHMRHWLKQYTWYLTRQALKPSRWKEERFHEFHRREIKCVSAELGPDLEFQTALRVCRSLLRGGGDDGATAEGPAPSDVSRYAHVAAEDRQSVADQPAERRFASEANKPR